MSFDSYVMWLLLWLSLCVCVSSVLLANGVYNPVKVYRYAIVLMLKMVEMLFM